MRFLLLFSLTLAGHALLACGPHYYRGRHFSFFDYALYGDLHGRQAFDGSWPVGYPQGLKQGAIFDKKEANELLWRQFGDEIGWPGLDRLVYSAGRPQLETLLQREENQAQPRRQVLHYLLFAGKAGALLDRYAFDPWDFDQSTLHPKLLTLDQQMDGLTTEDGLPVFLRRRYGFWAVRLAAETKQVEKAEVAFREKVAHFGPGLMTDWARGYLARAYYLTNRQMDAVLIYLEQMEHPCVEIAGSAHESFAWILTGMKPEQVALIEARVTTKQAKVLLWQQAAWGYRGEWVAECLQRAIALDPADPGLEAVAGHLMHAIEAVEITRNIQFFLGETPPGQTIRFEALRKVFLATAELEQVRHPDFWLLAGAYLAFLDSRLDQAQKLLNEARAKGFGSARAQVQAQVIEVLLRLKSLGQQAPQIELLDILQQCVTYYDPDAASEFWLAARPRKVESLMLIAGQLFYMHRDYWRSALAYEIAGFPEFADEILDVLLSNDVLDQLVEMQKQEANLHAFDRMLLRYSELRAPVALYYRQAVHAVRREQYEEARRYLAAYAQVAPLPQLNISTHDPMRPKVESEMVWVEMNLDEFCLRMLENQAQLQVLRATDPPAAARLAMSMGHLFYNLRRSGLPEIGLAQRRGRLDPLPHWVSYPEVFTQAEGLYRTFQEARERERQVQNNFFRAERYYRQVLEIGADAELEAQACVLIQMTRNEFLYAGRPQKDGDALAYFQRLVQQYKDTDFYRKFRRSCPLLAWFE